MCINKEVTENEKRIKRKVLTKDNRHIVFEGSGNLSDNARIEQYLIEDNETTYNFHKEWIINTLNK